MTRCAGKRVRSDFLILPDRETHVQPKHINTPSTGKQLLDKAEFIPMTKAAREFITTTTTKLDEVLASLPQKDQHDLLDSLAAEIEERLDQLTEGEE
jgi:hypothetical protein